MISYWRAAAQPIADAAYAEGKSKGLMGNALKAHISKAYPFGQREYRPYKIWLDVVNKVMAQEFPLKQGKVDWAAVSPLFQNREETP